MTFGERVQEIQRAIAAIEPALATVQPDMSHADAAVWRDGPYHATLTYHPTAAVPTLSVTMLSGEDEHPDPLEIGFDDPDAVDMVARPIAALLSGRAKS